jgi:phosphoenolpyruvate synthase/pyruvate phosphate dikinase
MTYIRTLKQLSAADVGLAGGKGVNLGERIESHYDRPQDIEWAWAGGRFHVLQARPITTPVRPRLA